MYKIKKLICKILIGMMIFSSLPINAFAENDNVIANDFETITQADEGLEEDNEIPVEENNEEISDEIEGNENLDIEESEQPEESEIPVESETEDLEEITENSDNVVMYSDLTAEEQKEVKEIYGVRGETFIDCENAGIDLYTTYEIGHALQAAEMSAQEYLGFKSNYTTAEEANYYLKQFANYRYAFPMLGIAKDAECKALLISGVNYINILSAKTIVYLLDADSVSEYLNVTGDEISSLLDEEDYNTYMSVMQEAYGVATMSEYDDESEASRYPQGAFTYDRNGSEVINMTTGSVGYVRTDFTLSGLNGLDLTISSSYDSSLSSNCVIGTSGSSNVTERMKPVTPLFDFSAGWSFDFSRMFVYDAGFGKMGSTLITSSGGRYTLSKSDLNNSDKTEISIYTYGEQFKDLTLKKYTGYTNDGRTSAYRLDYIDGRKEFFDDTGLILCIRNRFGNEIIFEYSTNGYEESEYGQEYNKVEIEDTCGRIVTIERGALINNEQETVISVKDIAGVDVGETVKYKNTLVENTADPYEKDYVKYVFNLTNITDQEDNETSFEYAKNDASLFTFFSTLNDDAISYQDFYPMIKIIHPTGAETQYIYEKAMGSVGSHGDSYQYYRITNRKDVIDNKIYNNIDYTYDNTYAILGEGTFSVSETNSDGVTTTYNYEKKRISSKKRTYKTSKEMYNSDNTMIAKVAYGEYYMYTYPKSVTTTKYDIESGKSVDTTEYFEYNEYRDLVKKWSAKASGNTDDEHKTSYEYDDRYHLLTKTTYNQDSDTTVEIVNELNDSGTRVAEQTKSLNGQLVFKEEYEYTNSANPSKVKSYTSASDYITKEYEYDASGLLVTEKNGGTVVASYENDIYNPFRYCGEYFDEESDLTYLRNRYYDPSVGAFINEDPIRDGLNWYVYCSGNPVMFVDPWGLKITLANFSSVEQKETTLREIRKLTGDVGYYFNEEGYLANDYNCEIKGGSETGRALVRALMEEPNKCISIQFSTSNSSDPHGGDYNNLRILMSTMKESDELTATFSHELAHAYTDIYGYDESIVYKFKDPNDPDREDIEKFILSKYKEATAITIEEAVRAELGFESRSTQTNAMIGVNGYGQFPYQLTTNPQEVFNGYDGVLNRIQPLYERVIAYTFINAGTMIRDYMVDIFGY